MKNSIITFVLFVLIVLPNAIAQQMPFSSQYYSNQFITNPALTGDKNSINAFLTHRSQFTGIAGGPQTSYFTIDGPVKTNGIGLGLTMFSDVTDILSRSGANASYSYKLDFGGATKTHNLVFGLALGLVNNKIDFSKITVLDNDDLVLGSQEQSKTIINSDFGLAYHINKFEIGFAVPQIIGNKVNLKNNLGVAGTYYMARHYYGTFKYTHVINSAKGITAFPLVMVRSVPGAPFQYDINAVIDWKRFGWFGVTYHSNYAVALSAGLRYRNVSVGYAYDLGISKVRSYTGTTSEFLLSYNFGEKKDYDIVIDSLLSDIVKLKEQDSLQDLELDSIHVRDSINELKLDSLQHEIDTNTIEIDSLKKQLQDLIDAQAKLKVDPKNPAGTNPSGKNPGDNNSSGKNPNGGNSDNTAAEKERLAKERIEKEIAEKQAKEDSLKMAQAAAENGIRTQTDVKEGYITIPGGTSVKAGFYVIIGAFTSMDNAKIFARDAKRKGYQTAVIIQNRVNSIYEIVVYSTNDKDQAIQRLEGFKKDYPDVWVLTLQ